jgi:hypothetical protein
MTMEATVTTTKEQLMNLHACLGRRLEAGVNAEGSWFYMNDLLELLLDAVQAVRAHAVADEDDCSVDRATAEALANVAIQIHRIADGSLSRSY